ncbi:ROK family protein [bacterium]|nr:ROK family protein [bacterium]
MNNELFIGIDLGGTDIKGGLVDNAGKIVFETKIPTEAKKGPEHIFDRMSQLIQTLRDGAEAIVAGIGMGVPGQVDVDAGVLVEAPNLPGVDRFPVMDFLRERIDIPVILDNDANVAALGEHAFGAGQGVQHMLMITLGTGVGGGLILNGQVFRGAMGGAGEFGHMVVEADGELCGCGRQGCVEAYVGTAGLLRAVEQRLSNGEASSLAGISSEKRRPKDLGDAAEAGDTVAREVFSTAGHLLGIAMGNVANLLNLERIVIGGGVAAAGERILGPARVGFAETALKVSLKSLEIVPAQLGNAAGLVGAARLAMPVL